MEDQLREKLKLEPGSITHDNQGVIQTTAQHKMELLHARETTGDRATNMVTGKRGTAGELWKKATGKPVTDFQCAVRNCPNPKYRHVERHPAEVAAHVYSTTQGSNDPVKSAMLTPTCKASNNRKGTEKSQSCYPKVGEVGRPLEAHKDAKFVPIEMSDKTEQKMNRAGKGTRKGGRIERGGVLEERQGLGGVTEARKVRGGALEERRGLSGVTGGRKVRGGALEERQGLSDVIGGRKVRGGVPGRGKGGGGIGMRARMAVRHKLR